MAYHIIVDGYNLIRQSHAFRKFDLRDIQLGRETLVNALAAYRDKKKHKLTVVFDGANSISYMDRRDRVQGVEIKFSSNGEPADDVIKRMCDHEREKAIVVSSDREIIDYALMCNAEVMTSPEFEYKMKMAAAMEYFDVDDDLPDRGWTVTTKKKGPGKRLSKRARKHKKIAAKL
ncbi:MAG: NYN domain-containing protein [Desulfobacterales bacterium]|nr:NYN domain-containing protein [Desulfobacterales bacterium]